MTISFTTVNTKLQQLKEDDSDLSDSEEEDESSHFHIYDNSGFQLSQLNEEFEPHISNIFNHSSAHNVGINTKIDLHEVIILDIKSTMNLLCNQSLVDKTTKLKNRIRLNSKSGTMKVQ